ncbi:MAG: hypothetical protein ACYTFN_25030 [Planctomycetota bacterium]|jgi:hypothetical protein
MIRPLRQRHVRLVASVAAIAAPLFIAALVARPAPRAQEHLPAALAEPASTAFGEAVELPTSPPIRVRAGTAGTLETEADGAVEGADLLLYWVPGERPPSLAEAWLLGALRGGERQVFTLPEAASTQSGHLVLYSLGHGEEVASTPWSARVSAP